MNKLLLFSIGLGASLFSKAQNWQATKLTNVAYLPIASVASHNNELFGTVSNGFGYQLYKMDAGGNSWSTVNTGSVTNVKDVLSAGTRMYVTTLNNTVVSMIYYSYDNGATYKADTVGLPPYFSGVTTLSGINYYKGKVIANAASYGYWIKDTSETTWKLKDVTTKMNGGADPMIALKDVLYAYDNTGTNTLYKSTDWGNNWTVVNKNLPADFACKYLAGDETTGRLYASGYWSGQTMTGAYYSDDQGTTWTALNFGSLIGKNANNQPQQITMLYALNNSLYIGLENDKADTPPNFIKSANGGLNLVTDSAGLPNVAAGVNPYRMLMHQGKQFLALNVIDVYSRAGGSGIEANSLDSRLIFFPNPASDKLSVATTEGIQNITISDITGRILFTTKNNDSIDVSSLSKGSYIASVILENGAKISQQFIKN